MEIFPAIDIREGKVVRLIQGDYDQQIDYAADPIETAKSYADAGANWLHIVDLDGAKNGTAYNTNVVSRLLKATNLQVQVGGGVRTQRTIKKLLDAGASRVIIGTKSLEDWDWFRCMVYDREFKEKIVLGMDARNGMLATRGWTQQTSVSAVKLAEKISDWPLAAIVYTDIACDGMLSGPNLEQVEVVANSTAIPVIASGGVASIEDVKNLCRLSLAGIIIGRALYEGRLDLAEAIKIVRR